jgi:hypothetical protein
MQIEANFNVSPPGRTPPATAPGRGGKVASDRAAFDDSVALEKALKDSPEVRPEVVEKAKQLVTNVPYPPPEVIAKISRLLGLELVEKPRESDSE